MKAEIGVEAMNAWWASRWAGAILLVALAGGCASGWSQSSAQSATPPHNPKSAQEASAAIDWNAPLPSAAQLKDRVLKNLKQSEAEQERYVCKTIREEDDTDKNGNVKQRHIRQYDMFFVNGEEIDELTGKDGKTLERG